MTVAIETSNIGRYFRIGQYSIVRDKVTIGDNVEICNHCIIGCLPLSFDKNSMRSIPKRMEPKGSITIGNDVFINSHSDVVMGLEGVTAVDDNVIMGQRVIVGHDSHVYKNVQLMNAVVINGHVTIGEYTMIGTGTIIRNRVNIGKNAVVGMGSVVVKDIPDDVIAYGNPCKVQADNNFATKVIRKIKKVF